MIRRVCLHIGRQEQGGHVQKQHKTTGHRAHKEVVCSIFNSFEHTSTGGGEVGKEEEARGGANCNFVIILRKEEKKRGAGQEFL